jgi:hypothetical protein
VAFAQVESAISFIQEQVGFLAGDCLFTLFGNFNDDLSQVRGRKVPTIPGELAFHYNRCPGLGYRRWLDSYRETGHDTCITEDRQLGICV